MNPAFPPPLPSETITTKRGNAIFARIAISMAILAGICVAVLVVLRLCGLIGVYSVPTASMSPAIEAGDKVFMEGLTYLAGKPQRGDLIVFETDLMPPLHRKEVYVKRLVGMPGDLIRITDGVVTIDGKQMSFFNKQGEVKYLPGYPGNYHSSDETFLVPDQHYFVIGDNSAHSADSRLWGAVPAKSVKGRILFCYWPPGHMGAIK